MILDEQVDESGRSVVGVGEPQVEEDEPQAEELVNIVELLTKEESKKLASQVKLRFDGDTESRAPYMRRCRKWKKMYHLVRDPKSFPFHGCANIGSPLLATVVLQIHARLFDMVWPADGMIFQSKPSTADQEEVDRAWRTEVFGNHYLRVDMPDYEVGLDDSLWQMVVFGSAFRFRAWDPVEGRIVVKWIPVDDFVVQYTERCTDPSLRGVPRYSWLRRMTLNEMEQYEEAGGYFKNIAAVRKASRGGDDQPRSEMKKATDEIAGVRPSSEEDPEATQRRVIEQYCWLKFPKSKKRSAKSVAFDGKMHPFVVDVDEQTNTVVRLALREEPDPKDAKRYQREMQEHEQVMSMAAEKMAAALRRDELRAAEALELEEADELTMLEQADLEVNEEDLEPPKPQRRRELCFFGHLRAFPNEGFYGTGFGDLVGPLNEATDLILNGVSDAMTLQNAGGGFISQSLTGPKGDVSVRPGSYVRVNGSPQSIRDGIQHHKFPGPSPVAMPMADTLTSMAHQLTASGSILSGEKGGSHETATTSKIRLEQAMKQISVLSRRVVGYMKHEIAAIWRLFSVFIDEDDAAAVVNAEGSPVTIRISRADFIPDANVTPAANPLVSSRQQRIEEAQERAAMLLQHPATQQMLPVQVKAVTDVLRAQGAHEYVEMIKLQVEQQMQAQQQAQQPPPMSQVDENMAMLQGNHVTVHPDDDDEEHLNEIGAFTETPAFEAAPPPVKMMLAQHRLEHLGQGYVKSRRANVRPNMAGAVGNGEVPGGPQGP